MLLVLAVLVLYGSTAIMGGMDDHVLPPLVRWSWWTVLLLACGLGSIYSQYNRWHSKALGLIGCSLFYVSYPLLWTSYASFIPEDDDAWYRIAVLVNIVVPVVMVAIGPIVPSVRIRREDD